MEHFEISDPSFADDAISQQGNTSTRQPFIIANTIASSLDEIKTDHIIPVFITDNETLISQSDFIDTAADAVREIFPSESIYTPSVRLSHPIKGRIPEAKNKPVHQLEDWERTIYYERMAFIIEVPSITPTIDGNEISLTIGGVKSFSLHNLYNRKGSDGHFKVFVGFQIKCVRTCVFGRMV
jgi:hypothetical protein